MSKLSQKCLVKTEKIKVMRKPSVFILHFTSQKLLHVALVKCDPLEAACMLCVCVCVSVQVSVGSVICKVSAESSQQIKINNFPTKTELWFNITESQHELRQSRTHTATQTLIICTWMCGRATGNSPKSTNTHALTRDHISLGRLCFN